jgi:uncharacterized protein
VQPFDKLRDAVFLLVALLCLAALPAQAQTFPQLAGEPVVDAANLLDPAQEAALNAKLKGIQASTGHQVAVATIPDLQGYDLADYGYRLGRAWGIGGKGKNDGVIVILAPNNPVGKRGPRIEVGYGLEPVMTDAMSSVIANGLMTPMLRAGDVYGALDKGVDAIATQIKLTPEEAAKRAAQAQARQPSSEGVPAALVFWLFIFIFVILPLLRGLGGRRHRRGSSGIGEVILWSAINAAVNSRDNDGGGWGGGGGFGGGGGGGFSGGGGSFGGGGASGGW